MQPSFPSIVSTDVLWVERRPGEAGRHVLVRRSPDGRLEDLTPEGYGARSAVHGYGGRCYAATAQATYFNNAADQRIYHLTPGGEPVPLTAEPPAPGAWRYGDFVLAAGGSQLVCVREREQVGGEVENDLVAVATDGSGSVVVLASGHDFYTSPCFSPDGSRLAFIAWDHPLQPWIGTTLYEAALDASGSDALRLAEIRAVAGGRDVSVAEPSYSPDGRLHFISDVSGWWNLYAEAGSAIECVAPMEAELTLPGWVLGLHSYGFHGDGSIVARWRRGGFDQLGWIRGGRVEEIATPYATITSVDVAAERTILLAGSPQRELEVAEIDLDSGEVTVLRAPRAEPLGGGLISVPRQISVSAGEGRDVQLLYYPPANDDFVAPAGESPPLLVACHAGPTMTATALLDLRAQFWTSRGFAYADVNYAGSTGFGRQYRELLHGRWGEVDVDDCCAAAQGLADLGLGDPARLVIHGSSAGGFTALGALTFRHVFAAGASYYGLSDLTVQADTEHKFEAHYTEWLVGPWPAARDLYEERSPSRHAELIEAPLILFQGLEDPIVRPEQAERMVAAMRANGIPFAYVVYENEGHGFRRADNIARTVEAELYFYGAVLGIELADEIDPVPIENWA